MAVCLFGTMAAQDTISGPDGKVKGWYMTYWYDTCFEYYDTNTYYRTLGSDEIECLQLFGQNYRPYYHLAKGERVKYPAAVKGVSVWVRDWKAYIDSHWPAGTHLWMVKDSIRLPEYIYIYQQGTIGESKDSMLLVDSVRWDTARYQILKVPLNVDTDRFGFKYSQLYTAYFDHPVEVDSLFFMVGTHNNGAYDYDGYANPPTVYDGVLRYDRGWPTCCPFVYSTPVMSYITYLDRWFNDTEADLYQPWGLFMPLIDFVDLHVVPADIHMGTAGPYDTVSKNTTQQIWAQPFQGYRFTHWNDGDTHNPRAIRLMSDTTFIAYFDTNRLYHVEVSSNRSYGGRVDGGGDYYEGDTAELRAVPLMANYRFVRWNDGDTSNPRYVVVTQDTAFEAQFAREGEGIEQVEEVRLFTLSPNPARDEVTVTAEGADGYGCWLTLRDEAGRELLRRQMGTYPGSSSHPSQEGTSSLILSTRGLAAGLYFVTLESPKGTSTQKLVVER
jgi:hypothetical protein